MDMVTATTASLVIAKSAATWLLAGATIEDETGPMNAKADAIRVAPHFFLRDQLQWTEVSYHIIYSTSMTAFRRCADVANHHGRLTSWG
jgi:hypothetical protein